METITVELKNKKALKLLQELEALEIIKLHLVETEKKEVDKASKYRGFLSKETADAMLKNVEESRNEWEERFPVK